MRRLAAALGVICAAVGAALAVGASGGPALPTYKVEFDNAFGLTEGGDFKIAGVRAGQTSRFEVSKGPRRKAVVEFQITKSGVGDLREDAKCAIRPQSLIGEYFVDCQPGTGKALAPGATIPVAQTSSTIPIDLVNNILRRPYRERLRLIIAELGTGLAGRPEDLAEVLRRAHPGLRETSRTLRILAGQRQTIERFIVDAERVVGELEDRKADVARWVDEAGETAAISASRREELRRNFELLPRTLDELRPYMARLGRLADEQIPLLADLERAGPPLDQLLTRLGPFAEAARPGFRGLGRASRAGSRAFRETDEEIAELREVAREAPALAKPLRQFLSTMDDRRRGVKDDPRAKATGPPPGDKTHIPPGDQGGFTGFESLLNYTYWQALSVNGRDRVGHVLRIVGISDDCANYFASDEDNPSTPPDEKAIFARCQQFLGPEQPGINIPDPTRRGDATTARRRRAAARGDKRTAPRRARGGSPGAPPASGDGSGGGDAPAGPQPPPVAPRAPSAPGGSDNALLDYLLAP